MTRLNLRFSDEGKPAPHYGVIASSLVLIRLPASFFSAHLLYSLGNRYEGHAVSRLILEQIAWAYEASSLSEMDDVKRIVTTRAISNLKKIIPWSGKLYGFLSKKTHLDFQNQKEFVCIIDERLEVLEGQEQSYEYAEIILKLADLFNIIWEISQFQYLTETETVQFKNGSFLIKEDRPFLKIMEQNLAEIKEASYRE